MRVSSSSIDATNHHEKERFRLVRRQPRSATHSTTTQVRGLATCLLHHSRSSPPWTTEEAVMLSFPSDLMAHLVAGESLAVGTVVRTFRSAPRSAGAVMAVAPNGEVPGSVSGGVPGAIATVTSRGPLCGRHLVIWRDRVAGSLGSAPLDDAVAADGQEFLTIGSTRVLGA